MSLRWQLKDTHVRVVEIIPPAVNTDLQAPGLHTFGVNVDEFADHVFDELAAGKYRDRVRLGSRRQPRFTRDARRDLSEYEQLVPLKNGFGRLTLASRDAGSVSSFLDLRSDCLADSAIENRRDDVVGMKLVGVR